VSQCGILTIQGNQSEAFSYPPTSYFLGVKAAGFAPHPGYGLLDEAGFPGARPAREQTDSLHQLLPLLTFLGLSLFSLPFFLQPFCFTPMLKESHPFTFVHR